MANYIPRSTPIPTGRAIKANYSAREVYEMLSFELNKVSAPFIDVDTFNHFHATARDNFYKRKYQLYDENQLLTDQLREMSATYVFTSNSSVALNASNETFPLPPFYHHLLSVTVFWLALANFRIYREGDIFNYPAERIAADRLAMVRLDHYNKPQLKKPYFLVRSTYVEIHSGLHSNARLDSVETTYLMAPEQVVLLESDLDDLSVDNSYKLRERGTVTLEVLKEMTNLVLENQGNAPRLQTHIPVSQVEPNQPAPVQAAPVPRQQ